MPHWRLRNEVLLSLVLLVFLALVAATWSSFHFMSQLYYQETATALEVRARLVEREMPELGTDESTPAIQALCLDLGRLSGTRITFILPSGKVIGDSEEDPAVMDNHADREEVKSALTDSVGQAIRYSYTLRKPFMYVAIPLYQHDHLVGVVRTSLPLISINAVLYNSLAHLGTTTIIIALIALVTAMLLSRTITRPIEAMTAGAKEFAEGKFGMRLPEPRTAELAELSSAMNVMAAQLRERLNSIERQRKELKSILDSMSESVIAVDNQERVVLLNPAASELFAMSLESAKGRPIQEVVRNPTIQECISTVLSTQRTLLNLDTLVIEQERRLKISASAMHDAEGHHVGALLVLNDVTEVHRLEQARSDFVANVSHEIRTPITAIKGYAETLIHEEDIDPQTREEFLKSIYRQTNRLSSLMDDILCLASLEITETGNELPMQPQDLAAIIKAAAEACSAKAAARKIALNIDCPENLRVRAHEYLLEQAISNLLDNAIKYSDENSAIDISSETLAGEIAIRVRDTGAGIPQEHLPRIFERFYRVDKARSRKLGGTGLGLAIVKHIVALHHGHITVESVLGKGSCFTILLPMP